MSPFTADSYGEILQDPTEARRWLLSLAVWRVATACEATASAESARPVAGRVVVDKFFAPGVDLAVSSANQISQDMTVAREPAVPVNPEQDGFTSVDVARARVFAALDPEARG